MKVIFIAPYVHPAIGGVESYILSLVRSIPDGWEAVIVTSSSSVNRPTLRELEGNKMYLLPIQFHVSNTPIHLSWHRQIKKIIQSENPDVINAHSPVPYMADVSMFVAGAVPVVLTYHSGSMIKGTGGLIDSLILMYEKLILSYTLNKASHVIAIYPKFITNLLSERSRFTFIPPGIDTTIFHPVKIKKIYDITFVGRIEKSSAWKGLDVLLTAISLTPPSKERLRVHIIGDGDAIETYKKQAQTLGISDSVIFAGKKLDAQLVESYNQSKIVVLPSKTESESFGMVLAEALACEIPVIASNIGGIPTIVHHNKNGLLVKANDAVELNRAMHTLIENDIQRQEFGEQGRRDVIQHFSKEKNTMNTYSLFEKVIKGNEAR